MNNPIYITRYKSTPSANIKVKTFDRIQELLDWQKSSLPYELALYMQETPKNLPSMSGLGKCRSCVITKAGRLKFKKDLNGDYKLIKVLHM